MQRTVTVRVRICKCGHEEGFHTAPYPPKCSYGRGTASGGCDCVKFRSRGRAGHRVLTERDDFAVVDAEKVGQALKEVASFRPTGPTIDSLIREMVRAEVTRQLGDRPRCAECHETDGLHDPKCRWWGYSPGLDVAGRVGSKPKHVECERCGFAVCACVGSGPSPTRRPLNPMAGAFSIGRPATMPTASSSTNGSGATALQGIDRKLLQALATHGPSSEKRLAILAGYARSGTFSSAVTRLRKHGYMRKTSSGNEITSDGRPFVSHTPLPVGQALMDYWSARLGPCGTSILEVLVRSYPEEVKPAALAEATRYSLSGTFSATQTKLRALGLVDGHRASREFVEAVRGGAS